MPVHMSLRDRRAYSLQVAFLSATRTSDLVPPSDELEWATVQVRGLAKEAAEGKREGDLDRFLAESAKSLKHLAKIRFKGTPSRETAAILGRTQALVGRIVCKDCCGNAICKGEDPDHDDLIVATNAALCIHDIKSAFRLAERLTAESVRRSTGAEPPDVKMVLETTGLMEAPGQIPGLALANNAQTTFDDSASEKRTRVCFEIAPVKLNRESLAALPAIALHEVFCHGYQMAASASLRPNRGEVVDPLSEGLMNDLAVECLEEFARVEHPPGSAEDEIWEANVQMALEIKIARASTDKDPRFPQALEVSLGRRVLRRLRSLYRRARPQTAENDILALAWALNFHAWHDAQRYQGLARLSTGLAPPSDAALLELLLAFPAKRQVGAIVRHLLRPD